MENPKIAELKNKLIKKYPHSRIELREIFYEYKNDYSISIMKQAVKEFNERI